MKSEVKCERLAGELRRILEDGITLGRDVVDYIDSTFSKTTAAELKALLADDASCEKDSLLELLFYPDEAMQLQLEELLEDLQLQKADEKTVLIDLLQKPVQARLRFPGDRGELRVELQETTAIQFISRLNISRHLNRRLAEVINRRADVENIPRFKVKIRNSRVAPVENTLDFLGRFFTAMEPHSPDVLECLDFALDFLEDIGEDQNLYEALGARKKFYFQSLQKAGRIETELQKNNVETLMMQGKRVAFIDPEDARKKLRIIDRISRAIFGRTEYFESLAGGKEYIEFGSDHDLQDILRFLS